MEYADLVLAAIVVVHPLAISVLVGLGTDSRISIAIGSAVAAAVILHALFVNPPGR